MSHVDGHHHDRVTNEVPESSGHGIGGSKESRDGGSGPLLRVHEVNRTFVTKRSPLGKPLQVVHAVDDVSIEVEAGATLGIVGESGSGKSTLGRVALGLITPDSGHVSFEGQDLSTVSPRAMRGMRAQMTMIFQDPYSSLDPRWTVGRIVAEPLRVNGGMGAAEQRSAVAEALDRVGLDADTLDRRAGSFSGGQRQRIGIARALVTRPRLVFCDEPVSALDVSTRAQVLSLLSEVQAEFQLGYLFVSHDLGVVGSVSDRIAVMYLGSVIEVGNADTVEETYRHPYTAALVSASPAPDPLAQRDRQRLVLAGDPPSPINRPTGCAFHPRCPLAEQICVEERPPLTIDADGHGVACHVTSRDAALFGEALHERMIALAPEPVSPAHSLTGRNRS